MNILKLRGRKGDRSDEEERIRKLERAIANLDRRVVRLEVIHGADLAALDLESDFYQEADV